jgi:hypothetical protein
MIDLVEFRGLLGPEARTLSEEEIEHIRDLQDGFADVIFEMWLRDRYTQSIQQNAKT